MLQVNPEPGQRRCMIPPGPVPLPLRSFYHGAESGAVSPRNGRGKSDSSAASLSSLGSSNPGCSLLLLPSAATCELEALFECPLPLSLSCTHDWVNRVLRVEHSCWQKKRTSIRNLPVRHGATPTSWTDFVCHAPYYIHLYMGFDPLLIDLSIISLESCKKRIHQNVAQAWTIKSFMEQRFVMHLVWMHWIWIEVRGVFSGCFYGSAHTHFPQWPALYSTKKNPPISGNAAVINSPNPVHISGHLTSPQFA